MRIVVTTLVAAAVMTTPAFAIETKFTHGLGIHIGKTTFFHGSGFGTTIKNGRVTLTGEKETQIDLGRFKAKSQAGGTAKF